MTTTRIADITVESLGSDATDADLAAFRTAAEAYTCADCGIDEAQAIATLWGDGDFGVRLDGGHCVYCHRDVLLREAPPESDALAWRACAADHVPGCEWIATRAHRRA